jgi:beta-galactosidase
MLAGQSVATPSEQARPARSPRERPLLNGDWRFHKGDLRGVNPASLLYDVRPEVKDDQAVAKRAPPAQAVLKLWILPTGNRFVKDLARRFVRPEGNPGGDVACVHFDFHDSGWQRVRLPHDWAIEGPFDSSGAVADGGMGRLAREVGH